MNEHLKPVVVVGVLGFSTSNKNHSLPLNAGGATGPPQQETGRGRGRRRKERGGGGAEPQDGRAPTGTMKMKPPKGDGGAPEEPSPRAPPAPTPQLTKESVFEWFGLRLRPAGRLQLLCGLLHMCQPLELRFLGSCLEDLARRDHHVLRDPELRANSAAELAALADPGDPVVLSQLLVCVSLLGSDNRECAGVLFRTLSRIEPSGVGPRPLEQLSLLLTMASLHPAFHFHQGERFREQLDRIGPLEEEEAEEGEDVAPEPQVQPAVTSSRGVEQAGGGGLEPRVFIVMFDRWEVHSTCSLLLYRCGIMTCH